MREKYISFKIIEKKVKSGLYQQTQNILSDEVVEFKET